MPDTRCVKHYVGGKGVVVRDRSGIGPGRPGAGPGLVRGRSGARNRSGASQGRRPGAGPEPVRGRSGPVRGRSGAVP